MCGVEPREVAHPRASEPYYVGIPTRRSTYMSRQNGSKCPVGGTLDLVSRSMQIPVSGTAAAVGRFKFEEHHPAPAAIHVTVFLCVARLCSLGHATSSQHEHKVR